MFEDDRVRCSWAADNAAVAAYHDHDWGRPPATDEACFEALTLEVFQAGLSWRTVLAKRDAFRRAFAGFSLDAVAAYGDADVARLLADPGIIRHRGKIVATIRNADAFLAIRDAHGSLPAWLATAPGDPLELYQALRPRLAFFGPTTCESFLQAVGKLPPHHDPACWLAR